MNNQEPTLVVFASVNGEGHIFIAIGSSVNAFLYGSTGIISHALTQSYHNIPASAPQQLTNFPLDKWLPFRRRYFQMHFREWKVLY